MRKSYRRGVRRSVLAITSGAALVLGALSVSSAASVSAAPSHSSCASFTLGSHVISGIEPLVRSNGSTDRSAACVLAARTVTSHAAYNGGHPPLLFNGGQVMGTNDEPGKLVITPIYWNPSNVSNTLPTDYVTRMNTFFSDIAHDSGGTNNVFSVLQQYTNASGAHIHYDVSVGTPITVTDPLPSTLTCTPDSSAGGVYNDGTDYSKCIDDFQIQNELSTVASNDSLTTDLAHIYPIFLPQGVEVCFTQTNAAHGGECTVTAAGAASGKGFCAYHSNTSNLIYAVEPWSIWDSAQQVGCGGKINGVVQSPSADVGFDVQSSSVSHEISEAITDPVDGEGWTDRSGFEIGDLCAYIFPSQLGGTSPALYDQTINSDNYFIQQEFSNDAYKANPAKGCQPGWTLPTATGVVVPSQVAAGMTATFSLSGFAGALGAHVASYTISVDGGTPMAAKSTFTYKFATAGGPHTISVTAIDDAGYPVSDGETFTSSPFTVTPQVTVSSMSPTSGSHSSTTKVTIKGATLGKATSVLFGTAKGTNLVVTPTKITVLAPKRASKGSVVVTVVTPAGSVKVPVKFTYR